MSAVGYSFHFLGTVKYVMSGSQFIIISMLVLDYLGWRKVILIVTLLCRNVESQALSRKLESKLDRHRERRKQKKDRRQSSGSGGGDNHGCAATTGVGVAYRSNGASGSGGNGHGGEEEDQNQEQELDSDDGDTI